MKKILLFITMLLLVFTVNVNAATKKVKAYVFTKDGCPYCESMKEYLNKLHKSYSKNFEIVEIQVYQSDWTINPYEYNLMNAVAAKFGDNVEGVPYLVVGDEYSVMGYISDWDEDIKNGIIKASKNSKYKDLVKEIEPTVSDVLPEMPSEPTEPTEDPQNTKTYSDESFIEKLPSIANIICMSILFISTIFNSVVGIIYLKSNKKKKA